jgi:Protein of unknown function (DUF732)
LAAPVHADVEDVAFIRYLDDRGINYGSESHGILIGHTVCGMFQEYPEYTTEDVASGMAVNEHIGLHDAIMVTGAAVGAYCPQYMRRLEN